ncbi:MAG: hypothetical protein M1831_004363 [Alyxoria varia]|nr:MAG: hypothetical protein M1831_004363 [Alyxoria varia]
MGSKEAFGFSKEENPLIAALPPATDYWTYLTLIEHNLDKSNLSTLHQILKDDLNLTVNIGWDLVHLLLPLLPDSADCLELIARLGNPREVLLKVTECLRVIDLDDFGREDHDFDDHAELDHDGIVRKTTNDQHSSEEPHRAILQFKTLVSMLSVLHPRVRTKYPSRFLSTTLQAVLATLQSLNTQADSAVPEVLNLIENLQKTKRPTLPPRDSSNQILTARDHPKAADPEASPVLSAQEERPAEDAAIHNRLLQAFLTHVAEIWALSLTHDSDIPGMAFSTRLYEDIYPSKLVPGRETHSTMFKSDEKLRARETICERLLALSRQLGLDKEEILKATSQKETATGDEEADHDGQEADPPNSPEDISLSKTGVLILLAARAFYCHRDQFEEALGDMHIFYEHYNVVNTHVGSPKFGDLTDAGTEPEAIVDAILFIGLRCVQKDRVGTPRERHPTQRTEEVPIDAQEDDFNWYLQLIAMISSRCFSPSLRFQAHLLTVDVLQSNESDMARLGFLKNLLEDCPFENLKAAAVGWTKGEIVRANPLTSVPNVEAAEEEELDVNIRKIFSNHFVLRILAPFLFPDLSDAHQSQGGDKEEQLVTLKLNLGFHMASLNLLFLLFSPQAGLRDKLRVDRELGPQGTWDVRGRFLDPLKSFAGGLRGLVETFRGPHAGSRSKDADELQMDLMVLEDALQKAESAI